MATKACNSSELTRSELFWPRAKQGHKIFAANIKKEKVLRETINAVSGGQHATTSWAWMQQPLRLHLRTVAFCCLL